MSAPPADLLAGVHLAIVLFMVFGLLLVLVGWPLGWRWIRNPWFRFFHLGVMIYIATNAVQGELCFLTHWEIDLREAAGQFNGGKQISFVGRLLRRVLYVEDISPAALHRAYLVFGALVAISLVFVRPHWFGSRAQDTESAPKD